MPIPAAVLDQVRACLQQNGVWDFSPQMKAIYTQEITSCKLDSIDSINPRSMPEIEGFLKEYFPRHFLKVQYAFNSISNAYLENVLRLGFVNVLDIGCGPATAALAVLDYIFQTQLAFGHTRHDYPYPLPLHVNFTLVDSSPYCLLKANKLITAYFEHLAAAYPGIGQLIDLIPRIALVNELFPEALNTVEGVSSFTGQPNIVLFSNSIYAILKTLGCTDDCPCDLPAAAECLAVKRFRTGLGAITILTEPVFNLVLFVQEQKHMHQIGPLLRPRPRQAMELEMWQINYDQSYSSHSFHTTFGFGGYRSPVIDRSAE